MNRLKITIQMLVLAMLCSFIQIQQVSARDLDKELQNVELMGTYIDFITHWIEVIDNPSNAIGIAQSSLKDLYMENDEPERLEQTLMQALEIVHDRGARNSIRFTLAEMYQENGQAKKASEQLIKIIEENSKGVMKKSKTTSVFE